MITLLDYIIIQLIISAVMLAVILILPLIFKNRK